ncbi:MAG: histidinol-phosphatase HisJ family protein [Oscillospiraceae bacterium]|nr:histidinol-phosphatase HisJ family protein [Oscillospiraceae bacterium]
MRLIDYHIHSTCSDDGHNTMLEMALASRKMGVSQLCFTDHCDLDRHSTGLPDPDCFCKRDTMLEMYRQVSAAVPPDMKILLGLELGEGNHDPEMAKSIAGSEELDFVLGSIHNLRGKPDFYSTRYQSDECSKKLIDSYMDELIELSLVDCFDVMAHIGYPARYIRKEGGAAIKIDTGTYGDMLRILLKNLIDRGKGIEINCSGFRTPPGGGPLPSVDILRLYRELGGEIITVGSDAHRIGNAGVGLAEGFDILRDLGYKYVTVFEKRKPEFVKI